MEQNQEPQNKSMHKWSLVFDKVSQGTQWGQDGLVNKNGAGKTTGLLSYTIHKN